MHSDSTNRPLGGLTYDLLPGVTLQELRSYYDAQPADASIKLLTDLVAGLRHLHAHAHQLEDLIATVKQVEQAETHAR